LAEFLLILNRNENIVPGVARLDRAQAAAYFMLGETTGTSAGGKDEEGKFLRVPGTNPFFPAPWPTWATGCWNCSTAMS
jgi:Phosphoenolpyruvate carboxykinase (ATP)